MFYNRGKIIIQSGGEKLIIMTTKRPHLIVIAGPNGAGKSTTAPSLLKGTLKVTEFVNADLIAQGLSGFNPEGAVFHAGRVMLERIHYLAEKRIDFAFETTLASKTRRGLETSVKQAMTSIWFFYGCPVRTLLSRVWQRGCVWADIMYLRRQSGGATMPALRTSSGYINR